MAGKLKITLIKSTIGAVPKHKKTVESMGFRKLNKSKILPDNAATRGQIAQIRHLIKVEEVNDEIIEAATPKAKAVAAKAAPKTKAAQTTAKAVEAEEVAPVAIEAEAPVAEAAPKTPKAKAAPKAKATAKTTAKTTAKAAPAKATTEADATSAEEEVSE